MNLHIDTNAVSSVMLADGWHLIVRGSFRLGTLEFSAGSSGKPTEQSAVWSESTVGFEFEDTDGGHLAGPLSSVVAVSYAATTGPQSTSFEQLAEWLHGVVAGTDDDQFVRFTHAGLSFEVWLDADRKWAFSLPGQRDGDRTVVTHTDVAERDVKALPSIVLGEVKGGWGRNQENHRQQQGEQ